MYATIRTYKGNAALADELQKNEGEIQDLLRGIDGFQAYYLFRTEAGDSVSLSLFDDRAGGEESSRVAREWIGANLPDLQVDPPWTTGGEVIIQA